MESAINSAGVFIHVRRYGAETIPRIVMRIPPNMENAYAVCKLSFTECSSCAPKNWAITTVAPDARPVKKPTIRLTICAAEPPTLASAAFPIKCPTITVSAVLYNCWKNVPNTIGKKNSKSCLQIIPSVEYQAMPLS